MRRTLRLFLYLAAAVTLLLAARSVSVTLPRTVTLTGPDGAPLRGYAAWHYRGGRFNFVDSISWRRPGGVAKSDAAGAIRLPWKVVLKSPFDSRLDHIFDMIYLPDLHEARGRTEPDRLPDIAWVDRTKDPEVWERNLGELYSLVSYDAVYGSGGRFVVSRDMAAELVALVRAEYESLLAAHARSPRATPSVPAHLAYGSEAEREAWRERMVGDLAEMPFWGPLIERRWAGRIADLEAALE